MNLVVTQRSEQTARMPAAGGFTGNLISQALQWNPTHPLVQPGSDSAWSDPAVGSTTINPLAQLRYYDDKAKVNTIIASISPSYKITNDLEYKFSYSINRQVEVRRGEVNRLLNFAPTQDRGSAFITNQENTNTQLT